MLFENVLVKEIIGKAVVNRPTKYRKIIQKVLFIFYRAGRPFIV